MKRAFFTPRWIITTLLVIAAVAVMARLGFWQLERLEQRRAFNQRVQAQIDAPPLDLNGSLPVEQLYDMEYRQALVRGVYDAQNEVILRNQVHQNMPGYHLLTPLRIEGSEYGVLVDRGYIPFDQADVAQRAQYAEEGTVEVHGIFVRPHVPRIFGAPDPTLVPGEQRRDAWNAVDLERIQQQVPYPLLPVYIQAGPASASEEVESFPIAQPEQPELSEGSHMGYALQWFAFALILAAGYPFFVKKQLSSVEKPGVTGIMDKEGG